MREPLNFPLASHRFPLYAVHMTPKTAEPSGKDVLVNVILDRSGSMETGREGTIKGFNEYLNGLRVDKETNYSVSLVQFDSPSKGPELTVAYTDQPLGEVKDLTKEGYEPRGGTPLYDAIGECCRRVEAKGRAVIAVVITDGQENSSTEFSRESIKSLIAEKEKEGWTFVFVGADIDSYAASASLGMAAMNTANYAKGNEQAVYSNLACSTVLRSASVRNLGYEASKSMAFFSDQQRSAMDPGDQGGRSPAPNPFPQPVTHGNVAAGGAKNYSKTQKRREWSVQR